MEIKCLFCQKNYICSYNNTKIVGPIIKTECPWCNKKLTKNLSSFIEAQIGNVSMGIQKAVAMQEYNRSLLSELFGG